jgi:molybdopterin biosynthesis enzyme
MSEYKPSLDRALELILERFNTPGPTGDVAVLCAVDRVAAETVVAPTPFPEQSMAMLDGRAVAGGGPGGASEPVRTGEPTPDWATTVIPHELLDAGAAERAARGADLRPSIVHAGGEYRPGDPIVEAGQRIDHRHLAQLDLFGLRTVSVYRRPRIRIAAFDTEPFCSAVLSWISGFVRSYYDADVAQERITDLAGIGLLADDTDLGILVSDGAPGRYDEIKALLDGAHGDFEMAFWKLGLGPPKHVGFGLLGAVPVLVFPDVFFKTVLSAMAFLPELLTAWVGAMPLTRLAGWAELPEIDYPYPCLVPLRFGDERRGLKVEATPLRSSFSARWVSAAEGFAILDRPPRDGDELGAVVLGRLGGRR